MSVPASALPKTTTTTHDMPDYVTEALRQAVERALKLSKEEYVPYTGRRIASSPLAYQQARSLANRMVDSFEPYARRAQDFSRQGQQSFEGGQHYQRYMAPYQHSVVDELSRVAQDNFNQNLMPEISNRFSRPMAGHSRHSGLHNEITRDMGREFQAQREDALVRGYEHALQAFNMDRDRELEAAELMSKLGMADQAGRLVDIQALERSGDLTREQEQLLLDIEYEMWKEQHRHPHDRLAELFGALAGAPRTASSLETTETHLPSSTMHGSDWQDLASSAAMNLAGSLVSGESASEIPVGALSLMATRRRNR